MTSPSERTCRAAALTYDRACGVLLWGGAALALASLAALLGLASFWPTFLAAWCLSAAAYLCLASIKVSPKGKAVLITGCDTGFGHAAALFLHKIGFRVFACCLQASGEGAQRLRREGPQRLHVLQLDVTSKDQIADALREVKRLLQPGEVLWGVVNNAGINPFGAVEWLSMEDYRRVAEVNLFGPIAVAKAFLPLVRRAKGRVVNVSSVRGRVPCPLGTLYDLTKFGIEAFSDGLRNEMRKFGVKVCIIEPGNFTAGTGIFTHENTLRFAKKMWEGMDEDVKEDYGKEAFDAAVEAQCRVSKTGSRDLTKVVDAISDALTQEFPQCRYQPMHLDFYLRTFISQHLPEWVHDTLYF